MLLTAVPQVSCDYAMVIKTMSDSISASENARQRLVMSTNTAQCNHLTLHLAEEGRGHMRACVWQHHWSNEQGEYCSSGSAAILII